MDELPFQFMNAAGWAKTVEHVKILSRVPSLTHIVVGSFTIEPREGNTGGTNFYPLEDGTTINALGLPNGGVPYLKLHGREMSTIAHNAGKRLVVSGAWFAPKDVDILANVAFAMGADVFERNDGCPNVFDGGTQKEIPAFNLDLMTAANERVRALAGEMSVWVKLSPYTNPRDREKVAELYRKSAVEALVTVNTIPNVRLRRPNGSLCITAQNTKGLGGVAGTTIRPLALANAEHFCELLERHCCVIGVGGISEGVHVEAYRRAGCRGVQIASAFFAAEDPQTLQRIANEWAADHDCD
jgi:dihydroorotate dehydrogenase (fumarate)